MCIRDRISGETVKAVDSAFNTLAQTVLIQNARTLEDLVREMLRPMLKSWLDDNLPGMVERIVRHEIERVSRGSGVIWVPSVCNVLCSMKKPRPTPSVASGASCQTCSSASVRNASPI